MAGASTTYRVRKSRGWRGGLPNLLRFELARWWKTPRWWTYSLLWSAVVGGLIGMMAATASVVPELEMGPEEARQMLGLVGTVGAVGVIIVMQGVLVGEKESGITGWILSKPVSRPAYILSRLLSNALGVLVTIVLAPGAVAYLLFSQPFVGSWLPPLSFLGGLAIIALDVMFYLALTLMLGAFFNSRGPVLAIPLALVFFQQPLVGLVPPLFSLLPYSLSAGLAGAVAFGEPLPFVAPIVTAAGWIVVFTALAIWRFEREEF